MGIEALPEIESKLRSRDVYSAWRLQPDMQVGIVHVKSERQLDQILRLVSRLATNRVGVSARFDDLHDTPQALHFAKVMLRGRPHQASPVAVFDGSILATAAVSAPDVMVKLVGNALVGFDDLPDAEREMLFETFRVWQDSDASVRAQPRCLFAIPTPCAIDCAGSSNAPADLSRAQRMSPNYVWLSKCAAGSCSHVDGCSIHRCPSSVVSDHNACYRGTSNNEKWRRQSRSRYLSVIDEANP